jgi:hypothetical protein
MCSAYEKLLQNLNIVKWELKERNDQSLNLCIKYIKDAIYEAGRLNAELNKLQATRRYVDLDVFECED